MPLTPDDRESTSHKTKLTHTEFAGRVVTAVIIAAVVILLLWLIGKALQIFLVLFAAVLFGVFLSNLSQLLHRYVKLPYTWALTVVVLLFFGILIGGAFLLAPSLVEQGKQLSQTIPKALQNLQNQLRQLPFGQQLLEGAPAPEELASNSSQIAKQVMGAFSTTLGAIANIFIIIVIGIYLAANPHSMAEGIVKLVPKPKRDRAREVLYTLGITLWGWLKGTLLAMLLVGIVITIGLTIIGVPLPLILGITAGLFEFVPNIGPFIAGAPAVLLGLMSGTSKAIWVIGLFVAVQSLEGWILTPMLQKKVIDLPPVLTISGQLLLGMLTGLMGLILAVPLMGVLMVLVKMLCIEDVLGDKDIEVKGEEKAKELIVKHQREAENEPEN